MSAWRIVATYAAGFAAGAGYRGIDPAHAADADWTRGWTDGRDARRAAVERERSRVGLGLGPLTMLRPASEAHAVPRRWTPCLHRWTPCPRCGRHHWLADGEVAPEHATSDDDRVGRPCREGR